MQDDIPLIDDEEDIVEEEELVVEKEKVVEKVEENMEEKVINCECTLKPLWWYFCTTFYLQ